MNSFDELELSAPLVKAIQEIGYTTPSPIQAQALPILLEGPTDFIGLAGTGTGKTAAFAIPLLEQLDMNSRAVQGLILCPTRELALQVCGQINLLGKYKNIKALPIYGGASYGDQIYGLKNGAKIVVGTPGRIKDHLERRTLNLEKVKTIILDEADEMISMGFKEDMEVILNAASSEDSQTWLFSATMSRDVRKVADEYLTNPKQVQVNRTEILSTNVTQYYYPAKESDKPEILSKLIETAEDFYGIIFCQTKSLVTDLSHYLATKGYRVDCLHGDKTQFEREKSMQAFRDKKISMLVCTDVASRGLDVKDVTHVINYSIPRELDIYVHRIGRTARSGKAGVAISFVTTSQRGIIGRIEQMTKSRMLEGRIPSRKDIGTLKVTKLYPKFSEQKNYDKAIELLTPEWKSALSKMTAEEVAGRFLNLISPEVFEVQDKKSLQPQVTMNDSRRPREGYGDRQGGGQGRAPSRSYNSGPRNENGGGGRSNSNDNYRRGRRYER